jgi:hypothetical protein
MTWTNKNPIKLIHRIAEIIDKAEAEDHMNDYDGPGEYGYTSAAIYAAEDIVKAFPSLITEYKNLTREQR